MSIEKLRQEMNQEFVKFLQTKGYLNSEIANLMEIDEDVIDKLLGSKPIEWGYNCLTVGIHHGRPEALWNLPLGYALNIFTVNEFEKIVIARIYNDAIQFVEHGDEPRMPKEWADQVKEIAEERYWDVLKTKTKELQEYYDSQSWRQDVSGVIERLKEDKLNPGYQPLHGHDSINLLCRIIGVSASREASK